MNAQAGVTIPFHAFADLFPLIDGAEFSALRDDVATHGVREPVVLFEGAILDGRNRYRAAKAAGVDCPMSEYRGDDPLAFVISTNLHRRHLSESQRAMVASRLANMSAGRPKETAQIQAVSQAEAATMLNVGRASVQSARKVHAEAAPEIVKAVEDGRMAVSLAARATALPKAEQARVVNEAPDRRALQKSVLAAVQDARKPIDRRNPDYRPNPLNDAVLTFIDNCQGIAAANPDLMADWNERDVTRARMLKAVRAAAPILNRFLAIVGDE